MDTKVSGIFAGAGTVIGLLAVTIKGLDRHIPEALFELFSGGFAGAFAGALIGLAVSGLWTLGSSVADEVNAGGNPFKVGLSAALTLCLIIGTIDLLFMQGTFIAVPMMTLLLSGSLDGTFWGCAEGMYDCVEEGCACFRN